jgi:hypothetical protein
LEKKGSREESLYANQKPDTWLEFGKTEARTCIMISDCESGVAILLGHGGYQRGIEDAFEILVLVCNVAPQRLSISGHEIDAKRRKKAGHKAGGGQPFVV